MPTPAIQTLLSDAQQVLNLNSLSEVRSTMAAALANANVGTPLNPNLTTQQLWDEFYLIVRQPESDIESIITNQLMKFLYAPPAPGGVGANQQVIFNDGGVLAGDPDLIFNKALNKLVANNIETAAGLLVGTSATITGALTVGASANFNGGALAAYLNGNLMFGSSGNTLNLFAQSSGFALKENTGAYNLFTAATGGFVFGDGAGGTRMTLNSTGLGIGVTPSFKGHFYSGSGSNGVRLQTGSVTAGDTNRLSFQNASGAADVRTGCIEWFDVGAFKGDIRFLKAGGIQIRNSADSATFNLDDSGNVGIGVTPSAWATLRGLQNGRANLVGYVSNAEGAWLTNNAFYDGSWKYQTSAQASHYQQLSGVHSWSIAGTGTAGNAITFTQAMTLDASGYLLLGTTDTTFTSGAGYKFGPGATPSSGQVGASSSNADLTNRVYSTGAAAYRFYVGYGGTVFATNTTISAISDQRLKENVQDIDVGLGAILALKPRKFDWKAGKGKDIKGDRGFIAQEFEQVFPQLVDNWADPSPEGEAPYKSVRQDLIPVLVKAIQELAAEVNALKNA